MNGCYLKYALAASAFALVTSGNALAIGFAPVEDAGERNFFSSAGSAEMAASSAPSEPGFRPDLAFGLAQLDRQLWLYVGEKLSLIRYPWPYRSSASPPVPANADRRPAADVEPGIHPDADTAEVDSVKDVFAAHDD